jgi:hypothetical protein
MRSFLSRVNGGLSKEEGSPGKPWGNFRKNGIDRRKAKQVDRANAVLDKCQQAKLA